MAASNPRHATPSPLFSIILIFLLVLGLLALLVLVFLFTPIIHPNFDLISASATPLSNTTKSTWNISLKVSNPSSLWRISYKQPHVSLSYTDKYGDFESMVIAETFLDPFAQRPKAQRIFYPQLIVSTDNVGKLFIEKIIKDQSEGLARFQVRVTFPMKEPGNDWHTKNVFCSDINIVFNKSQSGVASDLPKKCIYVRRQVRYHSN